MSAPKPLVMIGAVLLAAVTVAAGSLYTVSESQQGIVLQFGEYVRPAGDPGLHAKLPFFLQTVVYYDKRVLDLNLRAIDGVLLKDNRRLTVDAFVRYRITDPRAFYRAVTTEENLSAQLQPIVVASMRKVLSQYTLAEMLSIARGKSMQEITGDVEKQAEVFGIKIVDVRIGRADLPEETRDAVFKRMRTARQQEAAQLRAQGQKQSQEIRAKADSDRIVLLAEADRKSQVIRGEGDAEAGRIAADAYGADANFYGFWRSLQTYRSGLARPDAALVLSPDSPAFKALTTPPATP